MINISLNIQHKNDVLRLIHTIGLHYNHFLLNRKIIT